MSDIDFSMTIKTEKTFETYPFKLDSKTLIKVAVSADRETAKAFLECLEKFKESIEKGDCQMKKNKWVIPILTTVIRNYLIVLI